MKVGKDEQGRRGAKALEIPDSGKSFTLDRGNWGSIASACQYDCKRLAEMFGITPRHLARKFADELGIAPQEWLDLQRAIAAEHMLVESDTVKAVGLTLGFRHPANFHRHFKKHFGIGPAQFVAMQRGREISENVSNS